jgi:hypothetical protein
VQKKKNKRQQSIDFLDEDVMVIDLLCSPDESDDEISDVDADADILDDL